MELPTTDPGHNSPALIWRAGVDGQRNYFNTAWLEFTGRTLQQEIGDGWLEAVHPEDVERCLSASREEARLRQAFQVEYRLRRHDGEYRRVWDCGNPFTDVDGNFHGYLGVCYDITEWKQAEERAGKIHAELERKSAEVAALNQELASFSYSISHDLRAPLRHVGGFAGLMQKNAATLDEKNQRYLKAICEAAQQMEQLMDELLVFSRLGQAELHRTRINLNQLVREVRDEVDTRNENRAIVWNIGPLPDAQGDTDMLRIVLTNLISNAVKYSAPRDESHVEIGSYVEESGTTVYFVRDNGVGFDMRYSDKLFGVFQRLHRAEDFAGTGIGLANVRRIIHRHGGRTWAESAVDQGATFYFTLPEAITGQEELQ